MRLHYQQMQRLLMRLLTTLHCLCFRHDVFFELFHFKLNVVPQLYTTKRTTPHNTKTGITSSLIVHYVASKVTTNNKQM